MKNCNQYFCFAELFFCPKGLKGVMRLKRGRP